MSYKYARILLSGFRSAPIDPRIRSELNSKGYIYKNLSRMIASNIQLFAKYEFDKSGSILTGIDDIYDANYQAQIYELITGEMLVRDEGYSDASGYFRATGEATGIFQNPSTFFSKAKYRIGEEIYPVYEDIAFDSSDNVRLVFKSKEQDNPLNSSYGKYKNITGYLYSLSQEYKKEIKSPTVHIGFPYASRDNLYEVLFTGFAELSDYFYDPINKIISFYKMLPYSQILTGDTWPKFRLTVITRDGETSGIYPPGIFELNKYMLNNSGYVEQSGTYPLFGYIPKYPLARKDLSGFGIITGRVQGYVREENSGVLTFSGYKYGNPLEPVYQFVETGYKNSTGILNYNNPENGDYIKIENDLIDNFISIFTFEQDNITFTPPNNFDSIQTLNNIINSGSGSYGVYSEIAPNNKLKLISAISGKRGNAIKISSFGSDNKPTIENNGYLLGGQTYNEKLYPTGLFKSYLPEINLNPTGIFYAEFKDYIYGNLTGKVGYKEFTGIWDIYTTSDNIVFSSVKDNDGNLTVDSIKSLPTEVKFGPENYYKLKISYLDPSKSKETDIAKLQIYMNDILRTGLTIVGGQEE